MEVVTHNGKLYPKPVLVSRFSIVEVVYLKHLYVTSGIVYRTSTFPSTSVYPGLWVFFYLVYLSSKGDSRPLLCPEVLRRLSCLVRRPRGGSPWVN